MPALIDSCLRNYELTRYPFRSTEGERQKSSYPPSGIRRDFPLATETLGEFRYGYILFCSTESLLVHADYLNSTSHGGIARVLLFQAPSL